MKWKTTERYFRALLAQQLQIPIVGQIFFVIKGDDQYEDWLQREMDIPNELLCYGNDGVVNAYALATGDKNDVILAFPGAYDITGAASASGIDWAKNNTHLFGCGGPNTRSDYSEKNVVIYTDTATVDYTIHLTGHHSIFKNVGLSNAGANAGNYGPLYVNGYGNYFENVGLIGNLTSQQLADDDCASLHIGTDAHNCKWINCDIGEDCWGNRSGAYSGQVSFIGSNPNGGLFRKCFFRSASQTVTCAMLTTYKATAGTTHIGRAWLFDDCVFTNFDSQSTVGTNCNEVFHIKAAGASWPVLLRNCAAYGYDRWSDQGTYHIKGTMSVADDGGGLCIQLDETVAGGG